MHQHISFPSIGQFKNAIQQIQQSAKYHGVPAPKVTFQGTVKLHGTNAAVCRKVGGGVDDIYFQSRERIITPGDDNAGFAAWGDTNLQLLNSMFDYIESTVATASGEIIQVYGEWAGGSIQKGVGLNHIPKKFFVFGIRISENSESQEWMAMNYVDNTIQEVFSRIPDVFSIAEFPTWEVEIDMNTPTLVQNHLIELTESVEKDCPVARKLLGPGFDKELIGEGIVWTAIPDHALPFSVDGVRFKVKGEKHVTSKVKTLAPIDTELVKSVDAFVEYAMTENRLKQGLDKLREKGLELDTKNTGEYLKWVMQDVFKEESDTMEASGLTTKHVSGPMTKKAREFFFKEIQNA